MIYHIRKYINTDLENILSVWEKASNLAHPFLSKEFLSQERLNIQNIYIPVADTLVADVNGGAVGFISMIGNVVGGLFLDPEFHGLGIGRALMDKVRELHEELELEVFEKNSIGRTFYNKYGFKLSDRHIHEETGNVMLTLKYTSKTRD